MSAYIVLGVLKNMEFSVNSPVLFLLAGICVFIVLIQSVYFLVKA